MRFSKRLSVLVFGLLLGGICFPGAKASAEEVPADTSTLGVQKADQPVNVTYLTASLEPAADSELPDDPGAGVQQQQIGRASCRERVLAIV